MKSIYKIAIFLTILSTLTCGQRWTEAQAIEWYEKQSWIVGFNFIPSSADNVLEMFQKDTYDPKTIDRELSYASSIGYNTARVFLHYLLWENDRTTFLQTLNDFLDIASKNKIKVMFALFDDCWNPNPQLGPQPQPIPGVHNSQWVQCPGQKQVTDTMLFPVFEDYLKGIISAFAKDERVLIWDIYNEPGNSNHNEETLPLLQKVFQWAREANPSQPVTSGYWNELAVIKAFQLANSDIISFHDYSPINNFEQKVTQLKALGSRPIICSEYMARTIGSLFSTHLPYGKQAGIGMINWGLVEGRSQTVFPWNSPEGTPMPKLWFHDVFWQNGTSFDPSETALIKSLAIKELIE